MSSAPCARFLEQRLSHSRGGCGAHQSGAGGAAHAPNSAWVTDTSSLPLLLFRGAQVFGPAPLGVLDVLTAGPRIVGLAATIDPPAGLDVETVDARGMRLVPGLVDGHVHIIGGGGEGGPASRTPELRLSWLFEAGITSVVGCLGTDSFTRTLESLLMKVKGLRAEGVSAWMYTGAYRVPPPTLLGDVGRDITLIDEVIGVGEVAVADHRSSWPSVDELARIVGHARVGGMLGGKAGIVNVHLGDAPDPFRLLHDLVARTSIPVRQLWPTHCNRNPRIFDDAKTWGRTGLVDLTATAGPLPADDEEVKSSRGVAELLAAGVPLTHITMTSDACGSLPEFDAEGRLVRLTTARPRALLDELADIVRVEGLPLEQALQTVTSTPADVLKLSRKGRIRVGYDADLLLLDDDFRPRFVVARGVVCVRDGDVVKRGAFEV